MWGPARQTTVQSWAPGGRSGAAWGAWGACRGVVWGCGLLPSLSLRGCGKEDAGELRPESLGMGAGALAAGHPWLGWPGCPGVPWGQRLPTSPGCETTTSVSVTEVLRVLPQELTRRGDCGPGRPRGMTMKRKWGARMSVAVGTFPRPGGGRCPGLFPSSRGRGAVSGGGVATSQRVSVPGAVGTDPRWGRVRRAGRLAPPAQQPARRRLAFSARCRGGGGALGAVRAPSALLAARTARIMQQGAARACTARAGRAAPTGVGDRGGDRGGGGQGVAAGGWRVAGARTAHRRAPPPSSREAQLQGFWGPHPGAFAPPRAVSVWGRGGKGHSRP